MIALTEAERSAELDAEIQRYVRNGYRVVSRTPTTAQLIRPKTFSVVAAIFWTLILLVGLLIYLLIYAAQSDEAVYLTVDDYGRVHRQGNSVATTGEICGACGYQNRHARPACKRCKAPLTA